MHLFYNMYESIYVEIMIMPRVKQEADFVLKEAENNFLTLWVNNSILAGVQYILIHKILPQHRPLSTGN